MLKAIKLELLSNNGSRFRMLSACGAHVTTNENNVFVTNNTALGQHHRNPLTTLGVTQLLLPR